MAMKTKLSAPSRIGGAILLLCTTAAMAQDATPGDSGSGWFIKPRVSLTETLTDNANINRNNAGKQSDLISEITPGIRIEARTARLKGYLDYGLSGYFYANQSGYSNTQNSLNAFGTYEAVEKWLFVDFSGVIAQQSISAFGAQSPSNGTINNNKTETGNYRISPNIKGPLFGTADYDLRYSLSTSRSAAENVSDVNISQWTGKMNGATSFQKLGWTIDANQQTTDYSQGRKTEATLFRGIANYSVTPQFRLRLSSGWESNNYASKEQDSFRTYGYGFEWNPTERTNLTAAKERRFFGDGHNVNFNHRFPMSSIGYTDTRDISVLPEQFTTVGRGTYYDLYYQQCAQQLGNTQSPLYVADQSKLALAADACANTLLAQTGVSGNSVYNSGFATSQATVRRNQQFTWAVFGARNSLTLIANRSESQGVLATKIGIDALTDSTLIKQQGFSLNYTHQLSEISNLNALVSRQESNSGGTRSDNLKTIFTLYQLNVSTRLGAKTTGILSARRSEFDSSTNPYTENALIGTVSFIY
jgi:uncharacterized protein (PEP-CTERM system associated)